MKRLIEMQGKFGNYLGRKKLYFKDILRHRGMAKDEMKAEEVRKVRYSEEGNLNMKR